MKANRIRAIVSAAVLGATGLLGPGCSDRAPLPAPIPSPVPAPRPAPPLPKPMVDWRIAPLSPGDWVWSGTSGKSQARFAGDTLSITCDRTAGTVTLARSGTASSVVPLSIVTSNATRNLEAAPMAGPPQVLAVSLPARDPILDAMAFSRGRFLVEVPGLAPLVVPSWPEISRVIEDCR